MNAEDFKSLPNIDFTVVYSVEYGNGFGMSEEQEENTYLPGAASLIDQLDCHILIVLRDGRNLIGVLRSFDQYMNLVLEETAERVIFEGKWKQYLTRSKYFNYIIKDKYCDVPLGLFLVRGDSIVLLGEIDKDKEKENCENFKKISAETLAELLANQSQFKKEDWDFE
jgi:U6 snRNA-associated Sm-like protein LSm1